MKCRFLRNDDQQKFLKFVDIYCILFYNESNIMNKKMHAIEDCWKDFNGKT